MYGNLTHNTQSKTHRDTLATYRKEWQAYSDQPPPLDEIVDPEYLIQVFKHLKRKGGQAPGPDGISYNHLCNREVAPGCRKLSRAVLSDRYVVSPCREVRIPKPGGRGNRTLRLRNIDYRILSSALNVALSPMWEKLFLPRSMGFRPKKGVWDLLIDMEKQMIEQNAWVIAQDDVRKAFDFIDVDQLLKLHQKHIQDPQLLNFIETLLRGVDYERKIGIDQGSAYSPTCLNLILHYAHDIDMENDRDPNPLWYRYADNLIYVCQSVPEGQQVLKKATKLVEQSGLTLKGEDGEPIDLREGDKTQILGFSLSLRNNRLHYESNEQSLESLKQNLIKAHECPHPFQTANAVLEGWINSQGPIFENRRQSQESLNLLQKICAHLGFREIPSKRKLLSQMKQAYDRFQKKRDAVMKQVSKRAHVRNVLLTAPPVNVFADTRDMSGVRTLKERNTSILSPQEEATLSGQSEGDTRETKTPVQGEPTATPLDSRSAVTRKERGGEGIARPRCLLVTPSDTIWPHSHRVKKGLFRRNAPRLKGSSRSATTWPWARRPAAPYSRSPPRKRCPTQTVQISVRGPPVSHGRFSLMPRSIRTQSASAWERSADDPLRRQQAFKEEDHHEQRQLSFVRGRFAHRGRGIDVSSYLGPADLPNDEPRRVEIRSHRTIQTLAQKGGGPVCRGPG